MVYEAVVGFIATLFLASVAATLSTIFAYRLPRGKAFLVGTMVKSRIVHIAEFDCLFYITYL